MCISVTRECVYRVAADVRVHIGLKFGAEGAKHLDLYRVAVDLL